MVNDAHLAPRRGFPDETVAAVLADALAGPARVYGICGLQGSGKSTLAVQLVEAAAARGLRAVALSLDDFYLDRPQRQQLAREVHPLLATRGPPGTHDLALACATLDALRARLPVPLPRFDKRTDRRLPRRRWRQAPGVDLAFFEGWCLGVAPEAEPALADPVNALEREDDADGRWRRWCNAALARDYPALWRRIDRLLFLRPPGFEVVPEWRWQQEHALAPGDPGRGMDRAQLARFVQHYERISRQALRMLPRTADAVLPLDAQRRPGALRLRAPPGGLPDA